MKNIFGISRMNSDASLHLIENDVAEYFDVFGKKQSYTQTRTILKIRDENLPNIFHVYSALPNFCYYTVIIAKNPPAICELL